MKASEFTVPAPLFILGSPRSFTSVICAILGQHPAHYGVPELNLFIEPDMRRLWLRLTGQRQFMMHGLLRVIAQLYAGEQTLASIDMARRWILRRLSCSTGEVYGELAAQVAPLRIVDKSPVYCASPRYLRRIAETFPEACYLHLIRHPRTQGESLLRVSPLLAAMENAYDYSTLPPTLDPQVAWCRTQNHILTFLADIPWERQRVIRGEDFLSNPEPHLRALASWLGVTDKLAAMESMLHPEASPYACLGPLGAHLGNDINFLKEPHFRPGCIAASSLAGPLPWRSDGQGFNAQTLQLAERLGYA